MPECYIRGNTIKYLHVPDEKATWSGLCKGKRWKAAKRHWACGIDDGVAKGTGGGRGKGVSAGKTVANRGHCSACLLVISIVDEEWNTTELHSLACEVQDVVVVNQNL
ncbi:conserved hypothetical protein [Ricinus communis]|uniref:LSM domain-containing protein n=1 Tax=Ricinus communis TaxID=3988 RepID=B9RFB4_RICCO|nr:conserved hypothetical protein [Ricinus communis]